MIVLFDLILFLYFALLSVSVLHLIFLLLVYITVPARKLDRTTPSTRFLVVIPAHNEEKLLPKCLGNIKKLDYPKELFEMVVIADNCTDGTAQLAQSMGALCRERSDPSRAGKGYALNWFFENFDIDPYDAVILLDADSIVGGNFLAVMNDRINSGQKIIQGFNDISNYEDSYLTRLMYVTSFLKNSLYYEAKERLRLSSSLMGLGMCFSAKILKKEGWQAFSVGEDWEFYAYLILKGEKVNFASKAKIFAQEASTLSQGFHQRIRWAGGKFETMFKYGFRILKAGIRQNNLYMIDASLNILSPNYSLLLNLNIVALIAALLIKSGFFTWWAAILLLLQSIYFGLGLVLSRSGFKTYLSIIIVPVFLVWKAAIDLLSLFGYKRKKWTRTKRKEE